MKKVHDDIQQEQRQLDVLFSAWIAEKMKHEVLTFEDENGNIVEHYPNGTQRVLRYADYK